MSVQVAIENGILTVLVRHGEEHVRIHVFEQANGPAMVVLDEHTLRHCGETEYEVPDSA